MDPIEREKKIAEALHKKFCSSNHADGCGWDYHPYNWEETDHKDWLTKARWVINMMENFK